MSGRITDDWITGFLQLTHNTEPPILFRTWTAVSVLAACLKRKCYLEWGQSKLFPNMYIVLVAPSGKARKGTAMSAGKWFLSELGIRLAAEAITREALVRELKQCGSENMPDANGKMHLHSSLTIYSPELAVFLGKKDNTQLISDLTDWFDCGDKWVYRTKGQGTDDIVGLWVNLLGATTPELIQKMPTDAIGGGLTSRIVFVYEEKKEKLVHIDIMTPEEKALRDILRDDLNTIAMTSGEYKMTEDYMIKYANWYESQEGNPPFRDHNFSGYIERRPTHLKKLSMILNASRGGDMILAEEDFDRALALLMRTEVKMPLTFQGYGQNSLAGPLQRIMRTIAMSGEITFAKLQEQFIFDVDHETLAKMIITLERMNYCTKVSTPEGMIIRYKQRGESNSV